MQTTPSGDFVGIVVATPSGNKISPLFEDTAQIDAPPTSEVGSVVRVRGAREGIELEVLAAAGGPLRELYDILGKYQLNPVFPPEVMAETQRWLNSPGLDDPELIDLTALAFVTIDGATSRDLDQAVYVSKRADKFLVQYALADASYYVPKDSALWREAMKRAASYYLPGLMVPMLPRELSEGLVSLNANVDRRAVVFETLIGPSGVIESTRVRRARIRSVAKLSFEFVQSLYEGDGEVENPDIRESLALLKSVGLLRMNDAKERDVVRYRRREVHAFVGKKERRFIATHGVRHAVEAYNEQLSLMCNSEGARLLKESPLPFVEPIYRVHPAPDKERLAALRELIATLAQNHAADETLFTWKPEQSLSDYLRNLPERGRFSRLSRAIHRQAVMVNVRSSYQQAVGRHYGVGAAAYARFSAPMREIVGVFLHAELIQALRAAGSQDAALSELIIERANHAKQVQRQVTNEANLLVLSQLFSEQLALAEADRGLTATVMGMTPSKLYIQFDSPPIDAKLRLRDIKNHLGSDAIRVADDECRLLSGGVPLCQVGDEVAVLVLGQDEKSNRWKLSLKLP